MHTAGDAHKLGFPCWASGKDSEEEVSPLMPYSQRLLPSPLLELKACDKKELFFLLICPILLLFSNLKMFTSYCSKGLETLILFF